MTSSAAGRCARGTLAKQKPPVFGIVQGGGQVVIRVLENGRQITIQPLSQATIAPGTLVLPAEYDICCRLPAWAYEHKTVCHGVREYARDEDGNGFHEVHVSNIEGFCSFLRSWPRPPPRGVSRKSLPLYLGFCELADNAKNRGKRLRESLLGLLLR